MKRREITRASLKEGGKNSEKSRQSIKKSVGGFYNLIYFCFLSFGKDGFEFKISEKDLIIFKEILNMLGVHSPEHIDQLFQNYQSKGYLKSSCIHSIDKDTQQVGILDPRPPIKILKFYSLKSQNLKLILNDFFLGQMRLEKSVDLTMQLFHSILKHRQAPHLLTGKGHSYYQNIRRFIETIIKSTGSKLSMVNLDFKKNASFDVSRLLHSDKYPSGMKMLLPMEKLFENKVFVNEYRFFIEHLVQPRKKKGHQLYNHFKGDVKKRLDEMFRVSKNMLALDELDPEDFQNNFRMLLSCNFLKPTFSCIQIREASEVVKNKWFKN